MEKAAAIQYNDDLPAPIVLATGKGMLAKRIKQIARDHGIQIVDQPDLADALVELPLGSLIPEKYYRIVAEILVYVGRVS
ncbi:MAG: EscU/YscU/HrcU family type III secretion system export apparatus switch protein [Spirochaetaceae bacterium]|nr:MAG: EscU/YscU/HrcU family type III secretion system export apparatus switch protein [Spirochaetaceae bacterium]